MAIPLFNTTTGIIEAEIGRLKMSNSPDGNRIKVWVDGVEQKEVIGIKVSLRVDQIATFELEQRA